MPEYRNGGIPASRNTKKEKIMFLIEPCCTKKHLWAIRDAINGSGTALFEGYGDLSLTELLPALLTNYTETELLIAAPSLPNQAVDIIEKWMNKQFARMDGTGNIDVIGHLTIVTDFNKRKSPDASAWLKDNPFGERLTLVNRKQPETVILLPDVAIVGPVNMQYASHFVAAITASKAVIGDIWKSWKSV